MMYESKMAIAVKAKGSVLREVKSGENTTVFIPFGSEYSLLIKNLNSVRALVKVWIDGTDVTDGTSGLIVGPNTSVDLERYIKNGNLSEGNKFKFIERTKGISEHRGNKIDDGLIRVEFEFERPVAPFYPQSRSFIKTFDSYQMNCSTSTSQPHVDSFDDRTKVNLTYTATAASSSAAQANQVDTSMYLSGKAVPITRSSTRSLKKSTAQTETGITVAGSKSEQSFSWGTWFPTDGVKHAMVMQVLGELEGQAIEVPVTVKHKPTCTTCGIVNKGNAKFCRECGTALTIL